MGETMVISWVIFILLIASLFMFLHLRFTRQQEAVRGHIFSAIRHDGKWREARVIRSLVAARLSSSLTQDAVNMALTDLERAGILERRMQNEQGTVPDPFGEWRMKKPIDP